MIVSKADGSIIWANSATERVLGYSFAELTETEKSPGISWEDLTTDRRDLIADQEMVKSMVEGERTDYMMQKSYRAKSGEQIPSLIHVLRWPPAGDADCFLVSVMPLGKSSEVLISEIAELKRIVSNQDKDSHGWEAVVAIAKWGNENKLPAAGLLLFLAVLFGGDRVAEVAERVIKIFTP